MNRRHNLEVFDDTLRVARDEFPTDAAYESLERVRRLPEIEERRFEVSVTANDYIDDARAWAGRGAKRVLLVNSASLKNPGGGVTRGSKAAEEELCRRSNLFLTLERIDRELRFPLHGRTVGIGVPNVAVFKRGADEGYVREPEPFSVDVVCLFSRPKSHLKESSHEYHCGAWQPLVHFANEYRSEVVVIPPMGCGVFGNDPADVASALDKVLRNFQLETVERVVVSCFRKEENRRAFSWALLRGAGFGGGGGGDGTAEEEGGGDGSAEEEEGLPPPPLPPPPERIDRGARAGGNNNRGKGAKKSDRKKRRNPRSGTEATWHGGGADD